jgi:sigma-B regulation protein RsbU (phosphoserine phosphatase)
MSWRSDGLSEATSVSGEEFGDDRILGCIRRNEGETIDRVLACLLETARDFCAGAVQSDDVTVLIMRYTG